MAKRKWQKENNDLQNPTQKTKDRATQSPLKSRGELRCFGRVDSSCFSSGTSFVTKLDDIVQCQLAEIKIIIAYLISPYRLREGGVMVFHSTFNNTSAISWWSVLMMVKIGITWRKPPTSGKLLTNCIIILYRVNLDIAGFEHNICGNRHWLHR